MRRAFIPLSAALCCVALAASGQQDPAAHWRGPAHGTPVLAILPGLPTDPGTLDLVFDAPDKQLTPADVQKIAEAYLLLHGNHLWRIVGVEQDGERIRFAVVTEQNAPIASFAMNRHTGQLERIL